MPLSALAPGSYYILVQVDSLYQVAEADQADNILSATTGPLDVSVPVLTLGTPYRDSFTAADQNRYYALDVPAGGSLTFALASGASSAHSRVYVSEEYLHDLQLPGIGQRRQSTETRRPMYQCSRIRHLLHPRPQRFR